VIAELQGKVAVITGSSRGIGRGIAQRFASEGAAVTVNGRSREAVTATAAEIRKAGGRCIEVVADVTVDAEAERLFAATLEAFGRLDVLVNNAYTPVAAGESGPFLKMTSGGWDRFIALNLGMLFYCTQRAARLMAKNRVRGSIVNIGSNGSVRAHRNLIAYDSVKGAMDSFTRAVAVDLAPWGIRVNVLRPGDIAVDDWAAANEIHKTHRRATIPLGRVGEPDDVAMAAVFLASDRSSYITGQAFEVDGGLLVQGRAPQAELVTVATPENIGDF
jgi:NAD(P)-dependent dehydrogenase (short-subunit alcohol dehydrogenase family)